MAFISTASSRFCLLLVLLVNCHFGESQQRRLSQMEGTGGKQAIVDTGAGVPEEVPVVQVENGDGKEDEKVEVPVADTEEGKDIAADGSHESADDNGTENDNENGIKDAENNGEDNGVQEASEKDESTGDENANAEEDANANDNAEEDVNANANAIASTDGCPSDKWLAFHDSLCFYAIREPQGPFFDGNKKCHQLSANFTSIHSMEEFRFITAHFDLHQLWIGVFQGNPNFMDGTPVDPRVAAQFDPLVPWAWPDTLKGYICRRKYGDTKGEEVSAKEDGAGDVSAIAASVEEQQHSHEEEEANSESKDKPESHGSPESRIEPH